MKKIVLMVMGIASGMVSAQVGISTTTPANNYVSIEFGTAAPAENRGVLLPRVTDETAATSAPVGTFVFDAATQKIKLAITEAAATPETQHTRWFDYSYAATTPAVPFTNPAGYKDNASAKVIVDATSSPVVGILVLETPNPEVQPKAMVLPRVNNYTDIVNPSAGMMVYVKKNKRFAVFNGSQWSFWEGN